MSLLRSNKSFAARLTIPIVFTTVLTFLVAVGISGYAIDNVLINQAEDKSNSALQTSTLYLNESLAAVQNVVEHNVTAVMESYRLRDTSRFSGITRNIISQNDGILGSIVAVQPYASDGMRYAGYSCRRNGKISYSNISSGSYDYTTMDWYQMPILLHQPVWSEVYFDEGGADEMVTTYSYPVMDDGGNVVAILTADISLEWLTERAASVKPYNNSYNLVVSRCGRILTGGTDLSSGQTIFSYALENADSVLLEVGMRMMRGVSDLCEIDFEGDRAIATFGPLKNDWAVLIISDYFEVLKPAFIMDAALLTILVIGLTVLTVICMRVIKRHTRPLTQFAAIVESIGRDKLDNELPDIKTGDELATLRDAIGNLQNSMKENKGYRKDLQSAKYIQSSLVPERSLVNSCVDVNAFLEPAREVGGDLYDHHWSDRLGKLFVTLGDVSGKGLPASLMMSMVVSSVRLAAKTCTDSAQVVEALNDNVCVSNTTDMFVTLIYCVIDPVNCEMEICNAGHNPPVIISPDGKARYLNLKPNLVIGAMSGFGYVNENVQLEKGCRILFYTDGVTEAERPDKVQYGEERLLSWASSLPDGITSADAVESLREDVKAFTECRRYAPDGMPEAPDYPQNDDITIMMIKI